MTLSSDPLVSIVIPVYNAQSYVAEAIDSVLAQDYPNVELIVLDDGSSDETWSVIQRYPESSFYRAHHTNMGQAATLNKGWALCQGEIISYLSADDVLMQTAVSAAVRCLQDNAAAVMAYGDYYYFDDNSVNIKRLFLPDADFATMVRDFLCIPGPGAFWWRAAFEKTGGWDTTLRQIPDFEFWLRLGLLGKFCRFAGAHAKFRVHVDSQTFAISDVQKSEEAVRVMNRFFEQFATGSEIQTSKSRALSSAHIYAASLHLAAGRLRMALGHIGRAFRWSAGNLVRVLSARRILAGIRKYVLNKIKN
jgi:glycosyltransferase involved in cell wall biosynthesis